MRAPARDNPGVVMEANAGAETVDEAGGKVVAVNAVEPEFSGKPEDFARDMALIQAKANKSAEPSMVVSTPAEAVMEPEAEAVQPEGQPQATEPPKVPVKFLDKDGNPDLEKVEKSTRSAEAEIAKVSEFLAKEAELRKLQAEAAKVKQGYKPLTQAEAVPTEAPKASSFEEQIENDLKTHGTGKTLARLFESAKEAAYAQARQDVESLAEETRNSKLEKELESLAQSDPWVVTKKGMDTLFEYRKSKPGVTTWTEAYKSYLGDQEYAKRVNRQVVTPSPKAATAPPAPVTAGARPSQAGKLNLNSQAAVEAHLAKLTPEQEDKFWASQGMPPIHKKRR